MKKWVPLVFWRCWLAVTNSIRRVKVDWWGVGVVVCLEKGADCLHMVQLMRLSAQKPHCLLRHLNPDWFYLSGTGVVVTWKCIQCLEFSLGIAEKSSKCRNFCPHTHDRVTALCPRLPGWAEQKGTFTNSHPWGGRRRMRTDNKVHCVGAHPLYVALSQRGC